MLLTQFRHKHIHLVSTLLIIFAIVAKMLVPVAHASNAASNQKGFLASLCSGNKVVLVALNLPTSSETQETSAVEASSKCPLCNIIEQDPPSSPIAIDVFFNSAHNTFNAVDSVSFQQHLSHLGAIRAPPRFS